jgi:hypothetical protein
MCYTREIHISNKYEVIYLSDDGGKHEVENVVKRQTSDGIMEGMMRKGTHICKISKLFYLSCKLMLQ